MNLVDCVSKRDVYPQKMPSCFLKYPWYIIFVLKISVVYQKMKYIMSDIAWIFALKDKISYTFFLNHRIIIEAKNFGPG